MDAGLLGLDAPPVFRMIAPPDGGWSLTPIESLLRGLRNMEERFALEICGWGGGAVSYLLRSHSGARLQGLVQSYYPQARAELLEEDGRGIHADWLRLDTDERVLVTPLWLDRACYLPLKTYDDRVLRESESDPLAGVVGHISGLGRWTGGSDRDRMGVRLVLHPARENWASRYQSRIQARRDGDDKLREARSSGGQGETSNAGMVAMLGLLGLAGVAYFNWQWYQAGEYLKLLALDGGAVAALLGGLFAANKIMGRKPRQYLDEDLVEEKLKSLAFESELQLVRVYRGGVSEREDAMRSIGDFVDVMRQFDNPAGNSWKQGKVQELDGLDLEHRHGGMGLASASEAFKWLGKGAAQRSILSAREVSTLWHMPLGIKDMASIDRSQSAVLTPILEGLGEGGPLVGHTEVGHPVYFPESAIRKHTLLLGRSGSGKSTMIKHFIYHKMLRKARGEDDDAIVLIDPHSDLVNDVLKVVPPEIAHKVRLLNLGDDQRVPSINLLDPDLDPDRDRCVGTLIETFKHMYANAWGNRLEEILDRGLKAIWEYNAHPDTPREKRLTMLDLLRLLQDGKVVGSGRDARVERTAFQKHVFSRVNDAYVKLWFDQFMNLPRDTRAEGMGPVANRIGAFAGNHRSKVIMGQRESTVVFSDVLREGIILLVSTASGIVGKGPAALMGGTVVSLLDSALREQEKLPEADRKRCLLVCDEFQTVSGADWPGMFAELRKYGCSIMLATQSMAVLDRVNSEGPNLKSGIMANLGCLISYGISAEDAPLISHQMGAERVTETDLVMLDPFHCYVRVTTSDKSLPVFSMKTAAPPEINLGGDENVQAVRDHMYSYTVDRNEALQRINNEALDALWGEGEKIGLEGQPVAPVATAAQGGAVAATGPGAPDQLAPAAVGAADDLPRKTAAPAVNPFALVMKPVAAGPPSARDRLVEKLGEEAVRGSNFAPEVLDKIINSADTDLGVRKAMDVRLNNRVGRAVKDRVKGYETEIADLKRQLAEKDAGRENDAERVSEINPGPADLEFEAPLTENPEVPAAAEPAPRDVTELRVVRRFDGRRLKR